MRTTEQQPWRIAAEGIRRTPAGGSASSPGRGRYAERRLTDGSEVAGSRNHQAPHPYRNILCQLKGFAEFIGFSLDSESALILSAKTAGALPIALFSDLIAPLPRA